MSGEIWDWKNKLYNDVHHKNNKVFLLILSFNFEKLNYGFTISKYIVFKILEMVFKTQK